MLTSILVISVLAFMSVVLLSMGIGAEISGRLGEFVQRREKASQEALEELFIRDVTPRSVLVFSALAGAIVGALTWLLTGSVVVAVVLGVSAIFLPGPVFAYLRRQRLAQFDERLPSALDQIVSSARAGLSLSQALEEVSTTAPAPVSEELSLIVQDQKLGTDLGEAIDNARRRLGSRPFGLVATALLVNRDKGGNLPEALQTMSVSLKEIWRLEQKIITASSEGRKAVWVISAVPLFVFFMVIGLQPDLAQSLVSSFAGFAILGVAALLYVGGIAWLMRILRMDV